MKNLKKVAYQGIPGAFSDIAIKKYFKDKVKACPRFSFEEIFKSVKNKECDFGMVPIENSTSGSIYQNYDFLKKYDVAIVGEIYLKISHNLLVTPLIKTKSQNKRLKMINEVYSHPQALLQCQKFFKNHPWIKAIPAEDTAGSAKDLSRSKKRNVAAIASSEAAKIYKLEVLKKGIETNKNNFTRFVIIRKKQNIAKANKISLIFSVVHKPGSLYKSLEPFAKRKINLTKIESRPIMGKPWEYLFYLDFEMTSGEQGCLQAIKELKKNCLYLKILGFYKKGAIIKS